MEQDVRFYFFTKAIYSSSIAFFHDGVAKAYFTRVGSVKDQSTVKVEVRTFSLKMSALALVIIR